MRPCVNLCYFRCSRYRKVWEPLAYSAGKKLRNNNQNIKLSLKLFNDSMTQWLPCGGGLEYLQSLRVVEDDEKGTRCLGV
jgi:hypothetical protein